MESTGGSLQQCMFCELCLQRSCCFLSLVTDLKMALAHGEGWTALENLTWLSSYRTASGYASSRQRSLPLLQAVSLSVYEIVEAAEEGMLLAEACRSRKISCSGRNEERASACLWKKERVYPAEGEKAAETWLGSSIPSFQDADLSERKKLKPLSSCHLALYMS